MLLEQRIEKRFGELLDWLVEQGREEITQQGHVATGRGRDSLEGRIEKRDLQRLEGWILAEEYMVDPVNDGVKASKVPYGGGGGSGKSKYIQGLIRWLRTVKPSLSDQERKGVAFAIAQTAKREGHPTRGSYSFSQNGRRTGWIQKGLEVNEREIEKRLRLEVLLEGSLTDELEKAIRS
jgi:hypothetical protein